MISRKMMEPKVVANILYSLKYMADDGDNVTHYKMSDPERPGVQVNVAIGVVPSNNDGKDNKKIQQDINKIKESFEKIEYENQLELLFIPDAFTVEVIQDKLNIRFKENIELNPAYRKRLTTLLKKLNETKIKNYILIE